jgi:formate dehydrogenase subunit gamma
VSTSTLEDRAEREERRVPRFDRTERIVHWCNATLFLTLVVTGASLYAGPLSTIVAHRLLVKTIHVYSGLLLPIPILIGIALRSGAQLRADLRRLNRWIRDDRLWWTVRGRAQARLGKFNPGQKLNAVFIGAAIVVMLGTGSIMRWFKPFPVSWRTGATFVHDWFALTLFVVIIGHIVLALNDPDSLRGMVFGWVPERWARRYRPRWYAEVVGDRNGEAVSVAAAGAAAAVDAIGDAAAHRGQLGAELGAGAGEMTGRDPVDGSAADRVRGREL